MSNAGPLPPVHSAPAQSPGPLGAGPPTPEGDRPSGPLLCAEWGDAAELFTTLVLRQVRPHAIPAVTPAKAVVQRSGTDPPLPGAGHVGTPVLPDRQVSLETLLADLAYRRVHSCTPSEGDSHGHQGE